MAVGGAGVMSSGIQDKKVWNKKLTMKFFFKNHLFAFSLSSSKKGERVKERS